MQIEVTLGQTKLEVTVRPADLGRWDVTVDGRQIEVEAHVLHGGVVLRIGERVLDVVVGGHDPSAPQLAVAAHRVSAALETERQRRARERRRSVADDGAGVIESPMHGRVVKVLVGVGDAVAAGQPVAVVEAMKMENEVKSRGAGTVREVRVAAGDAVEVKSVLVVLQ